MRKPRSVTKRPKSRKTCTENYADPYISPLLYSMREPPESVELTAHLLLAQTQQDENHHQQKQSQPVPVDCRFHGGINLATPSQNRTGVLRAEPLDGIPDDGHVGERKNVEHGRYFGALRRIADSFPQDQIAAIQEHQY